MRSDEELVLLAGRGDEGAFSELYYRYRDWVYRLAWRFTGEHEASLDTVQEVFAYLLERLPGLRLRCRLTTFLYPAVKHVAIRAAQKRRRFLSPVDPAEADIVPAPPAEGPSELADALRGLSGEQREAILMRYVDDMTVPEIAAALKVPEGTVKSRLHHALRRLREDPRTREYFLGEPDTR